MISKSCIYEKFTIIYSLEDPHREVQATLEKYSSNPESEPRLKLLLPHIVSTFGSNKSVKEIMDELEKYQESDDATGNIYITTVTYRYLN